MKKEDLIRLKRQILELNDEEKKERDIYLQGLADGTLAGPAVGYASIDKPQLRIFDIEETHKIKNTKTVYQDILDRNKDNMSSVAIMYFRNSITYRKMFENIDKTAQAFSNFGVKPGDFVTVCCAGIPEMIYSFYGLSKIGAVLNLMPYYFDKKDMIDRINDCKSETVVVMDKFYNEVKDSINNSCIKNIIIVPTLNSTPLKYLKRCKKIEGDNIIYWNDFIKKYNYGEPVEAFEYQENYPLCMVYSSGTTGSSKSILLSNDSFQNSVLSYKANTYKFSPGQRSYQIIPPWYSTGLNTCIHLPLHEGITVFQDPRFDRKTFVDNVIKYKLDYTIAPTSMYEGFLDDKITRFRKIKELKYPFEGGEALNPEVKKNIEKKLKAMGCDSSLLCGYGQCECGAQVTIQHLVVDHPDYSVGLPLPNVTVAIFDDDNNELPYNTRGNVYVNTPCGMLGYYDNDEANKEYFYIDEFGIKWSKTGDIGYIMPQGDLAVEGRASDYSIVNGSKVFNFDVENIVRKEIKEINNCDVLQMCGDINGELALHIIFNKDIQYSDEELLNFFKNIQEIIYRDTNNINMVPSYFKVRENFPHKPSGKRNIEELKGETEGFVYLDKNDILSSNYKRVLSPKQ